MNWRLRLLFAGLLVMLFALQFRLWYGEGSLAEVSQLRRQITQQQTEMEQLRERNAALVAEVEDLKSGLGAVEARARRELGMIREGETFYQVIESPSPSRD
jgi:cell division protein FtsB